MREFTYKFMSSQFSYFVRNASTELNSFFFCSYMVLRKLDEDSPRLGTTHAFLHAQSESKDVDVEMARVRISN